MPRFNLRFIAIIRSLSIPKTYSDVFLLFFYILLQRIFIVVYAFNSLGPIFTHFQQFRKISINKRQTLEKNFRKKGMNAAKHKLTQCA